MGNKISIYLDDSPIIKNDFFNIHTNIAETLYEVIKKYNIENGSFTIGLFGEWGSGKSFIINLLKEKIKNDSSNLTFLYIDVWKYSEQPLLRSILFELDKQFKELSKINSTKYSSFKNGYIKNGKLLNKLLYYDEIFQSEAKLTSEEFNKAIKKFFHNYRWFFGLLFLLLIAFLTFKLLPSQLKQKIWFKIFDPILTGFTSFVSFIGIGAIFLNILQKPLKELGELVFFKNTVKNFREKANFSSEQFEEIFKDMLSKIKNEKFVIVFDNIDRCEPRVAYETLSTIKTYMDIKNCFYIIPCDDEAIKKYLTYSNLNSAEFSRQFAEEFIDKIFQTYIRIPILKEIDRDKFIENQLKKIDIIQYLKNENYIDIIKEILYYAYRGETPRNIKRFINDFSSYFHLVLKSYPELLNDIPLFTVMIAIKQKWYKFEKIFINNPTFFKNYLNSKEILKEYENIENFKDFKSFLEHIEFYIKSFQEKPIDGYIYLKKSEASIEIVNKLKNGEYNIELNDEVLKILLYHFERNVKSNRAYALNSFISIAFLIKKYKDSSFYYKLLKKFWECFENSNANHSIIIETLYKRGVLDFIINTLNNLKEKQTINSIENIFINYIKPPLERKETEIDENLYKIFEILITSTYKFSEKAIKSIFNNWKIENKYLNNLIETISKHKKYNYLPEQILDEVIKQFNQNPQNYLKILKYWENNIPQNIVNELATLLIDRIENLSSSIIKHKRIYYYDDYYDNEYYINNKDISNIEIDYNLLKFIDNSFISKDKERLIIENVLELLEKIFFSNIEKKEIAIDLWFELIRFDIEEVKEKLDSIFKNNIEPHIDYFIKNLKYPEKVMKLPITKEFLLNSYAFQIYEKLDKKFFSDFEIIFPNIIKESYNIEELLKFINERKIEINIGKLIEFLLDKAIKDKKNKISNILKLLNNKFKLINYKDKFISHKNGIIDIYKEDTSEGYNILEIIKKIIPLKEFNEIFIEPLFKYLDLELEATRSIEKYRNISNLFDISKEEHELKELALKISKKCLAKDQKIEENELGLKLLIKIYQYLDKENLDIIKSIIKENENKDKWNQQLKDKLSIFFKE